MNNIYIMSLEAADIYNHINRGKVLYKKYVGMTPFSLESIKLQEVGLKVIENMNDGKFISNEIINLKFNKKVKSIDDVIKDINAKIVKLEHTKAQLEQVKNKTDANELSIKKLEDKIAELNTEVTTIQDNIKDGVIKSEYCQEVKSKDLRKMFYENGFKLKIGDRNIGFLVYGRTSAKSRTGQVLFIKKQLKNKMTKWKRLGMNLEGRNDIDYPALLSYESLVSSSIEATIEIDPKNILIVSDVQSVFNIDVNVVKKDVNENLESRPERDYQMKSELFDGEGFLSSDYFMKVGRQDKGMMLLRQHMFKSCVFNVELQQFLEDNCPSDVEYDEWKLKDMFGQDILAKDVHMVITPSSLKALKFSHVKGSKPKMYKHWKNKVKADGNIFGICKSEKESKRGTDAEGRILNQSSYQMLNSLQMSLEDVKELSSFELNYIEQLKNNDDVYVDYLAKNINDMNSNQMLVGLYNRNSNIVNTKVFRDKRKTDIKNYANHVKRGKLRLIGDYCVLLGNPAELLYHAIGKLPLLEDGKTLDYDKWKDKMVLKDNEVYTKLHDFDKEYVAFRNPHTSPSNVLVVKNTYSEFIEKYFNLSSGIVGVNVVNFEICRILSGADFDSDTAIIFDNEILLKSAKQCYKKYKVCVNEVGNDDKKYTVSATDMSEIDHILSESQSNIGCVVNLGQHYMSKYWDMINTGTYDEDEISKVLEAVDICTVLSELAIDAAKKPPKIDMGKQIRMLSNNDAVKGEKPQFFKYISKNENTKNNVRTYQTSMDYLQDVMEETKRAEQKKSVELEKLLIDVDEKKIKNKQVNSIVDRINKMSNAVKELESRYSKQSDDLEEEKYNYIEHEKRQSFDKLKKYKIKTETIVVIIEKVFTNQVECKYKLDLLNALYRVDNEKFIGAFKKTPENKGVFSYVREQ